MVVLVAQPIHLLVMVQVVHREVKVLMDQTLDQDMVVAVVVDGIQDHSQNQKEKEHHSMEEVHSEVNFLQHSEILRVV